MTKSLFGFIWLGTIFLAAPAPGGANEEAGWGGRIEAGIAYLSSTDQFGTSDGNKRSGGLSNNADRYDEILPLVLFDLRYTFSESGRSLYLKTPIGEEGPPGLALGGTTPLGQGGELDVALFTRPFGEAWKDPYLVDQNRQETDEITYGVEVDYSRIWGTGLGASYTFSNVDVDEDDIGDRFNALERDGSLHQVGLGYVFGMGPDTVLEPRFDYTRGDLDGGANSFEGYGLKFALRRITCSYGVNLFASVALENYNDEHPVFGKEREDLSYGMLSLFSWLNLFGNPHLFANFLAGYSYRDSNIEFLDASHFVGGTTIGYQL